MQVSIWLGLFTYPPVLLHCSLFTVSGEGDMTRSHFTIYLTQLESSLLVKRGKEGETRVATLNLT